MDQFKPFLGEIAALGAAFLWASASLIFTRLGQTIPPILLNICKGLVAIALLLLTIMLTQVPLGSLTPRMMSLLVISGILGIGIGDTAYLSALRSLGARRTLLIETLAPPLAAILAFIFLGEALNFQNWIGIALTLTGVAWVITERTSQTVLEASDFKKGVLWAILAAISQAGGVVLSRSVLVMSDINPLWTSLIRLIAGTAIALLIWEINGYLKPKNPISWSYRLFIVISLTAFGSTYLGIWLQQISLKFSPAGISQTLSATSPLFVLPMAYSLGEKITRRSVIGVFLALMGVGVLFLGR